MNWIQKSVFNVLGFERFVNPIHFERYSSQFVDPIADFQDFSSDINKLKIVFENPAVLKVFQICCNMFSQGKVYVYNKNGVEIKNDPFLNFIKKPNPFQPKSQFLWDYQFWRMIGNAYMYSSSKIITNSSLRSYWLDSSKIQLPVEMEKLKDRLILSNAELKRINDFNIRYTYSSGDVLNTIKWGDIIHIPDLSNGIGNWFRGTSKINALYKVISNSDAALDSKNINIRYAGKFIVAGKSDPDNVSQMPLSETEKETIEQKVNGKKSVHAVKSMVDIKRFVETAAIVGELDDSYLNDYFVIGSMFDIPKDVLEAFNSGTYENQEKARGAFIGYCLQPAAEQLCNGMENFFDYGDKNIVIDWEHLPFMQVFAKERAETGFKVTQSLLNLIKAGVKIEEINSILDLNLTEIDYEAVKRSNQSGTGNNQNEDKG